MNWYGDDLLCTVIVRGACDGTASITLDLGRKRAARAELTLSARDASSRELLVPAAVWQRALQHPKNHVYETLRLRIRVAAQCTDGTRGPERQTWSDTFVGAFSGGE